MFTKELRCSDENLGYSFNIFQTAPAKPSAVYIDADRMVRDCMQKVNIHNGEHNDSFDTGIMYNDLLRNPRLKSHNI